MNFVDWMTQIRPDFLARGPENHEGTLLTIMDCLDELKGRCDYYFRQLYPAKAVAGVLPLHAEARNLNLVEGEPEQSLRATIGRAWEAAAQSATEPEMLYQVRRMGFTSPAVVTYNDLFRAGKVSAFGQLDGFWFLVLPWPVGSRLVKVTARWGGGAKWGEQDVSWGGGGLRARDIEALRQVIFQWKPADTSCRFIAVALDASATLLPDLTLDGPWVTYPVNETWEFDAAGVVTPYYNQTYERP